MKLHLKLLAAAILLMGFAAAASAGEPTAYRVLAVDACPQIHPSPAAPYSYGWFGAAPRVHATRHFGTYRMYTEWSWR